jgi:hypothetical protein
VNLFLSAPSPPDLPISIARTIPTTNRHSERSEESLGVDFLWSLRTLRFLFSSSAIIHLARQRNVNAAQVPPLVIAILQTMTALSHLLTLAVLAIVLRWLWNSSTTEQAKFAAGCQLFPPTRAMRILTLSGGFVFTTLFVWSRLSLRQTSEWWVSWLFLAFGALFLFAYPPLLSIKVDGIASRYWFGQEKKIRWEEIASLHFNSGNRQFTVRANDGRKISHAGFNSDPAAFQTVIHERTRLPLKITQPGTWKSKTFEVPYEEFRPEEDQE